MRAVQYVISSLLLLLFSFAGIQLNTYDQLLSLSPQNNTEQWSSDGLPW